MKKVGCLFIILLFTLRSNAQIEKPEIPSSWINKVESDILQKEYHIRFDDACGRYQSPNRAQNIRAYYTPGAFTMQNRKDSAGIEWQLTLQTKGIYADGQLVDIPHSNAEQMVCENVLNIKHPFFTEQYVNSQEGVRQNFIIQKAPVSTESIEVRLLASGLQFNNIDGKELHFYQQSTCGPKKIITYNQLKVWDACGKSLKAYFTSENDQISIIADVRNAVYPITIDPLSSSADWTAEINQTSAYFGTRIGTAGDVNGDGYSDVVVGAARYDNGHTDEGAYFVYHGSSTGLSTSISWQVESDQTSAWMGHSIGNPGDFNGDGYSDLVVSAYQYDNGHTDEGKAWIYHGSSTGLSSTAAWSIEGNQTTAFLGYSISSAGDINGDGYSDVLIGGHRFDNGHTDEGIVYCFHGSSSGANTSANWSAEGSQTSAEFGVRATSAGDVNADGYSDVIIGAYKYDNGQADEGGAWVYHGSASGLDASASWTGESNQASANYGIWVGGAGDVNGDGYSDVIVGAHLYDNGQTDEGKAWVYHGSASGVSAAASWSKESDHTNGYFGNIVSGIGDVNGDGYADVSVSCHGWDNGITDQGRFSIFHGSSTGLSTTADWTKEGGQSSMVFAYSGPAGDVNGDGFSDLILSAYAYDNGHTDEGKAWVYHGSASGLKATSSWATESNQADANYGVSASYAGDVNGDGYSDVIVGAHQYDNGQAEEGAAWVYHGASTGLSTSSSWQAESDQASAFFGQKSGYAGDVNGDGYSDVFVSAAYYDNDQADEGRVYIYHGSSTGLNTSAAIALEKAQADARFGNGASTAGDVNGDGYDDFLVGAFLHDRGQTDEGMLYVFLGSSSGLSLSHDRNYESDQASAAYGFSCSYAGDVNGDGYDDIIVGGYQYDNGESNEGIAHVYHGSSSGLSYSPDWSVEGNQAAANFGYSVAGVGDVNGDGFSDVMVGAPFYSNGQANEGKLFVYHGSSTGLSTSSDWTVESNQATAYLGISVGAAGDVNGDGYSDILGAAHYYDNGNTDEGAVFLYQGSSTGLGASSSWSAEGGQNSAYFGASATNTAGDVNGDGFGDVIIGCYACDNGSSDEGQAFVYYGNNGGGLRQNLKLYNTGTTDPLDFSNRSVNDFTIGLFAKSYLGRAKAKLVWEIMSEGEPFSSASPITNSTQFTDQQASFTDLGLTGLELTEDVVKSATLNNKVRVRVKYDPTTSLSGQSYSPWKYLPTYLSGTAGGSVLPIELLSFKAKCNDQKVQILWQTASEKNNDYFTIERSTDYENWQIVTIENGAGNSNEIISYQTEDQATNVLTYYRLKQTDINGENKYFPATYVSCNEEKTQIPTIFPNPNLGEFIIQHTQMGQKITIHNTIGQVVYQAKASKEQSVINLMGLPKGIYTVQLYDDYPRFQEKIVLE